MTTELIAIEIVAIPVKLLTVAKIINVPLTPDMVLYYHHSKGETPVIRHARNKEEAEQIKLGLESEGYEGVFEYEIPVPDHFDGWTIKRKPVDFSLN